MLKLRNVFLTIVGVFVLLSGSILANVSLQTVNAVAPLPTTRLQPGIEMGD